MKLLFEVNEQQASDLSKMIGETVEFYYSDADGKCIVEKIEGNWVTLDVISHVALLSSDREVIVSNNNQNK